MAEAKLNIDEIFLTISGEGKYMGFPTAIIRLFGCPFKCSYCDQPQTSYTKLTVPAIVNEVSKFKVNHFLITGGEPLAQKEVVFPLVYELNRINGSHVWIETSGGIEIECTDYRRTWGYSMDIKCPSSGMDKINIYKNLKNLHHNDEVKFVIADAFDYEFAKRIISRYATKASIILSPVFSLDSTDTCGADLVKWVLRDKLINVRVLTQLHKILGCK